MRNYWIFLVRELLTKQILTEQANKKSPSREEDLLLTLGEYEGIELLLGELKTQTQEVIAMIFHTLLLNIIQNYSKTPKYTWSKIFSWFTVHSRKRETRYFSNNTFKGDSVPAAERKEKHHHMREGYSR